MVWEFDDDARLSFIEFLLQERGKKRKDKR
jgi:hypothetical protein